MKNANDKVNLIPTTISRNRIVMPPMDTLMSEDGFANDFHIQHYGARAYGGVGTIIVESTAVSPEGRIRIKDLGIWKEEHVEPMARIAKIAKQAGAVIGVQINHAGAKSETLETKYAPGVSYFEYIDQSKTKIVDEQDLKMIEDQFVSAALRVKKAGFDFVELHSAHGYFLSEMLHPQMNEDRTKTDVLSRAQILINIVNRIHDEVKIPVGIRFSFEDHSEDGVTVEYFKPLIKLIENKIAYIHASSGETTTRITGKQVAELIAKGGKTWRMPLTKQVKAITSKPVIAVGNVSTLEDVNGFLNEGIDAVAIGRELLYNPNIVVNKLLDVDKMSKEDYHWNQNIWFNHVDYKNLKKKLGQE